MRKTEETLLLVKRLAATCAIVVFGLSAIVGFGSASIHFAAEVLSSTKTGSGKTVADIWPFIAGCVAAIEWSSLQRIGLWVSAQSVMWVYFGIGIVCFILCGVFVEVYDSLEQRQRWRHSLEQRRLVGNASLR